MKLIATVVIVGIVLVGGYVLLSKHQSKSDFCGIQECHGMELTCGSKPADVCTEIYMVGDGCRTYFQCGVVNGACSKTEDRRFDYCTSCVKQCLSENKGNDLKISECDSLCVDQVTKLK